MNDKEIELKKQKEKVLELENQVKMI